jgi:hypothetical protein
MKLDKLFEDNREIRQAIALTLLFKNVDLREEKPNEWNSILGEFKDSLREYDEYNDNEGENDEEEDDDNVNDLSRLSNTNTTDDLIFGPASDDSIFGPALVEKSPVLDDLIFGPASNSKDGKLKPVPVPDNLGSFTFPNSKNLKVTGEKKFKVDADEGPSLYIFATDNDNLKYIRFLFEGIHFSEFVRPPTIVDKMIGVDMKITDVYQQLLNKSANYKECTDAINKISLNPAAATLQGVKKPIPKPSTLPYPGPSTLPFPGPSTLPFPGPSTFLKNLKVTGEKKFKVDADEGPSLYIFATDNDNLKYIRFLFEGIHFSEFVRPPTIVDKMIGVDEKITEVYQQLLDASANYKECMKAINKLFPNQPAPTQSAPTSRDATSNTDEEKAIQQAHMQNWFNNKYAPSAFAQTSGKRKEILYEYFSKHYLNDETLTALGLKIKDHNKTVTDKLSFSIGHAKTFIPSLAKAIIAMQHIPPNNFNVGLNEKDNVRIWSKTKLNMTEPPRTADPSTPRPADPFKNTPSYSGAQTRSKTKKTTL